MPPDLSNLRRDIATLAARKTARRYGWPRDWRPQSVVNPEDGSPYTDEGAWELIAHLCESGVDIENKVIDEGHGGKAAYVIIVEHGGKRLYIKVQLGSGCIIGRSFHYSHHEKGS